MSYSKQRQQDYQESHAVSQRIYEEQIKAVKPERPSSIKVTPEDIVIWARASWSNKLKGARGSEEEKQSALALASGNLRFMNIPVEIVE